VVDKWTANEGLSISPQNRGSTIYQQEETKGLRTSHTPWYATSDASRG
jgi:hypothetical protein